MTPLHSRMIKELEMLDKVPPPGISCWPVEDTITELEAVIQGPESSPFEKGFFKVKISIPARYPFEPPDVRFLTKIYHPNVDEAGRICLDTLKMPPKGTWKPSLNLCTLLHMIKVLIGQPNPEDGLVIEISDMYRSDYSKYCEIAQQWTLKYATESNSNQ